MAFMRKVQPPMIIKAQDWDHLRMAGRINGRILVAMRTAIKPGMHTAELNDIACQLLAESGAEAPFVGYPPGGEHPYPAAINVSVNEELVHGIPGKRVLQEGDIVTLDCGTQYKGLIADSAITVPVGIIQPRLAQLIQATEEALAAAITVAEPGRRIGDIAYTIQRVLRNKYRINIPPQFGGHGVGYKLHAAPHVPNYGMPNRGERLVPGMALAIEPMGMLGSPLTRLKADHWTVVTADGSPCAHTEHTILITENGAEVITLLPM
jgi:methionyl aminopeptidase